MGAVEAHSVTVVAVPVGRGRWAELTITYTGRQVLPLIDVRVGATFEFGGVRWRIRRVLE